MFHLGKIMIINNSFNIFESERYRESKQIYAPNLIKI